MSRTSIIFVLLLATAILLAISVLPPTASAGDIADGVERIRDRRHELELLEYQEQLRRETIQMEYQERRRERIQEQALIGLERLTHDRVEANLISALIRSGRYRVAADHEVGDIAVGAVRLMRAE